MSVAAPITAQAVLDAARSQLGVAEQPPGSNENPYGAWYGWNGVAWCDEFFCWCDWDAGWKNDFPKFAATTAHAAWFQKNGAWLPKDETPPVGAAIFYDWGQGIAHIGRWEGLLSDGRISSLEGNTDSEGGGSGGRVMRQYRSRALIAGFGVITYQPTAQEDDEDMDYVIQLSEDITYQGTPIAKGTAYHVVGQVLGHISQDELDSLKGDGVKVVPAGPYRAISTFDKTTDNIHRLLKA